MACNILSSGKLPKPRTAVREKFIDANGKILDDGICLYFRAPHSFTGQDVLELHGHGGGICVQSVLARCLQLGARQAEAGEFTLRAYLNDKMDLAQAEAVADLINAGSEAAARAAANSLNGAFSRRADKLQTALSDLRADVEAALDFADEETGVSQEFSPRIKQLTLDAETFLSQCRQGAKLSQGMTVAITGKPNAGKSSLLNALCGEDAAIVSAAAGTTRDLISRDISIKGMPVRLMDTAGLRRAQTEAEKEGIARARQAAQNADLILSVRDSDEEATDSDSYNQDAATGTVLNIRNKIDLSGIPAGSRDGTIYLSAKTGEGIGDLQVAILRAGNNQEVAPAFTARIRHMETLQQCLHCLSEAQNAGSQAEIAAAWLASAQQHLTALTAPADDEDLLAQIFSRFCIGK